MGNKFTINSAQFRVAKKDIVIPTIVDGEEKEVVAGWVKIRGEDDPVYHKRVVDPLLEYQEEQEIINQDIREEKDKEEKDKSYSIDLKPYQKRLTEATEKVTCASVAAAIEDWDEEYFGCEFSYEKAMELFSDPANNITYNQIAKYMKDRESFLPNASEQQ